MPDASYVIMLEKMVFMSLRRSFHPVPSTACKRCKEVLEEKADEKLSVENKKRKAMFDKVNELDVVIYVGKKC